MQLLPSKGMEEKPEYRQSVPSKTDPYTERFIIQNRILQKLENQSPDTEQKKPEVADVFRQFGESFLETHSASIEQKKVMCRISTCRTAFLGGHMEICDSCGHEKNAYNSCRDRHCPKCGALKKEKWLNDRMAELLPCSYFHLVFTLPHDLNPLILCNKEVMLKLLFHSANEILQDFAADPQWKLNGQLGIIAVLHTWNQVLLDHFHLHCLVPAGALSHDRKEWHPSHKKWLFRQESMSKAFRNRYLQKLTKAGERGELIFPGNMQRYEAPKAFDRLIRKAKSKKWVVYAKKPFAGPEQVLEYMGRYTHRVAISNNRILSIDGGKVVFSYRDRQDENKQKKMSLDADEFIRRFLLHVLPSGFMKIRYYGFLSHRSKEDCIEIIRELIGTGETPEKRYETMAEMMLRLTGEEIDLCPKCKKGRMVVGPKIRNYAEHKTRGLIAILDSS